ncbi:hypothetical protein IWW57_003217 [Coemansia sp. S610]|nr:hypothetical protein IWW57_003217 [Coemansia sp. S610]
MSSKAFCLFVLLFVALLAGALSMELPSILHGVVSSIPCLDMGCSIGWQEALDAFFLPTPTPTLPLWPAAYDGTRDFVAGFLSGIAAMLVVGLVLLMAKNVSLRKGAPADKRRRWMPNDRLHSSNVTAKTIGKANSACSRIPVP